MNEDQFSDSSFVHYLIDNINQALIDTETDLNEYLKEIKEKLMKTYVRELKKNQKKASTMNLFKNLASMLKKKSIKETLDDKSKSSDKKNQFNISKDQYASEKKDKSEDSDSVKRNPFNKKGSEFDPKSSIFTPKSKTISSTKFKFNLKHLIILILKLKLLPRLQIRIIISFLETLMITQESVMKKEKNIMRRIHF